MTKRRFSKFEKAVDISTERPVVISKFIENAREIEIDGVAKKGGELGNDAITEHVENAGTHSGDATVVLPPQRTYLETIRRAKAITKSVIKELNITGPFNIQMLSQQTITVQGDRVRRCAHQRSFPFVSKVDGIQLYRASLSARTWDTMTTGNYRTVELDTVCAQIAGRVSLTAASRELILFLMLQMASTREVACFGDSLC